MGTHGELFLENHQIYRAVECPWKNNRPNISCVPVGLYKVIPIYSSKYGDNVLVLHNPTLGVYAKESMIPKEERGLTRFSCLFHPANVVSELEGCIALGEDLGFYKDQWSVTHSADSLNLAYPYLEKAGVLLIKNVDF